MILAAVVKWVAGRRVDNYNLQVAYPISYAVGYEVSYKNHYYLIPDLMKIADSKMYQDKAYKKKNQKQRECPQRFRRVGLPRVSLRTGIYYDIHQEENPDRIISHANTARRIAKEDPLGICVYSGKIEEGELRKADVLHSFRGALEKEEFKIYFQPKVSGTDESIRSAEVLVRWQREDGQIWTPDRFLPVLEETGKIETLDFYVYEMAFQWLEAQKEKGEPQIYLSLNVSPAHFRDVAGFTRQLLELIGKYQIDSRYLIFSDHGECLHSQYRCGQPDERDASRRTDPDLNG